MIGYAGSVSIGVGWESKNQRAKCRERLTNSWTAIRSTLGRGYSTRKI